MDSITLYILAVVFLATLIRSAMGFGDAMVAIPLLALRVDLETAVPLVVLVSVFIALFILAQDWRKAVWGSVGALLPAAMVGIPIGLWLLTWGNDRVIRIVLGVVIIFFASACLILKNGVVLRSKNRAWEWLFGVVSGTMGGAYGMSGPPIVVYGTLRQWTAPQFRASMQGYFLPVSLFILASQLWAGLWNWPLVMMFFQCVPVATAAVLIGRALNTRMDGPSFVRYAHMGLIIVGGAILLQSI